MQCNEVLSKLVRSLTWGEGSESRNPPPPRVVTSSNWVGCRISTTESNVGLLPVKVPARLVYECIFMN